MFDFNRFRLQNNHPVWKRFVFLWRKIIRFFKVFTDSNQFLFLLGPFLRAQSEMSQGLR